MNWLFCLGIFSTVLVGTVFSLRLEKEGSCHGLHHLQSTSKVDANFLDRLRYIVGGNRYHIYRLASHHPKFSQMREYELYYDACLTRNTSSKANPPYGITSGFGGLVLGRARLVIKRNRDGSVDEIEHWEGHSLIAVQHVVLSDHKTFAVLAGCWSDTNQPSWAVYSSSPEGLSPQTMRQVEEHVVSLGYDRKQVAFLSRKNCGGHGRDHSYLHSGGARPSSNIISYNSHSPRPHHHGQYKPIAKDNILLRADGGLNSEDLLRHLTALNNGKISQSRPGWMDGAGLF